MMDLTVAEAVRAVGGTAVNCEKILSKCFEGVEIDSRKILPGFLFVPIKGEKVDGHRFISQVMGLGALAVLSEVDLEDQTPYIKVESTGKALRDLAAFYRTKLDIPVVGITGSVGKTSTKEMIASILSEKYNVLKTEGNYNNEIGLPLTVFRLTREHELAVLEMGIDHFGEMHMLASISRPDICVITNIGQAHMEILGSRDGIFKAKTEVFDHLRPNATVILNGSDDKLIAVKEVQGKSPLFFGPEGSDAYADQIQDLGLLGTDCRLRLPCGEISVHIPVPGAHMVYNALAGALVGLTLGLTLDEIARGTAALKAISGRTNLIPTDHLLIIDDCYNASPVSMMGAIDILATAKGRTVAILGDMFELGTEEAALHFETGKHAGEKGIDLVICIGNLAKNLYDGAKSTGSSEVHYYASKADFFAELASLIKSGDNVLVKASHGMEFPEIVEKLKNF